MGVLMFANPDKSLWRTRLQQWQHKSDSCARRYTAFFYFHTYVTYSHINRCKCTAPKLKARSAEYFCLPCRRFPHHTSGTRHTNPPPPLSPPSAPPLQILLSNFCCWSWKLTDLCSFLRIFKGNLEVSFLDELRTPVNPPSSISAAPLKSPHLKHDISCHYFLRGAKRRRHIFFSTPLHLKWIPAGARMWACSQEILSDCSLHGCRGMLMRKIEFHWNSEESVWIKHPHRKETQTTFAYKTDEKWKTLWDFF